MKLDDPDRSRSVARPKGAAANPTCTPTTHLPKAEDFLLWPPNIQAYGYRIVDRLFNSRVIHKAPVARPHNYGERLGLSYRCANGTFSIDELMDRNSLSGLLVLKDGAVVVEQYGLGLLASDRWSTMSTVKSITATLVGVALQDGAIGSLADPVTTYVPSLAGSLYDEVTIKHLLTMSSGMDWTEDYADKQSDVNRYSKSLADGVPGGVFEILKALPRAHPAGTHWHYNTGDTFLLGAALRNAVDMPLAAYLSRKVWQPCGMEFDAFYTLESPDGLEIGGSRAGIALRDFGRFAKFVLDDGVVDGQRVLPQGWNNAANRQEHRFSAADVAMMPQIGSAKLAGYGYSWWIAEDGALIAMGFAGQRIYINRAQSLAIITLGAFPQARYQGPGEHDRVAEVVAFTEAVKQALTN
ncbi:MULTISPECIES: serine hydrolase domain-containing protein [Rhodopseudomonas]|uniref:Beta-lactamase n=1 Tax=Rhodopseudomonas palustris TaxID=1076 RepID=A0A0D7E3D7_RHOPL|nr:MULTISPECIES: serine hydrolase domain-containing protein [Rhodopseudomonas]KIZ34117.1 beta-lactamase [Rhodopseudomonas palustris]MDF3812714.1 serine hydrolase [Rhodopseudomonas sp. BAL398]WOK15777.1 serine hydrolase domain-containing protein [Rhodopseudomonas sp. BAL398]